MKHYKSVWHVLAVFAAFLLCTILLFGCAGHIVGIKNNQPKCVLGKIRTRCGIKTAVVCPTANGPQVIWYADR